MKTPRTALLMLLATLLLAPVAEAEELIPPGNSAVTQYTESLPTPRGQRDTESRGGKGDRSPEEALGKRNAQRLEQHGSDGREAAEAAAATAPPTDAEPSDADDEDAAPTPPTGGAGTGGGEKPRPDAGAANASEPRGTGREPRGAGVEEPAGSSGLGEVLGEATGTSSDGETSWLLPLLVVAIAAWALTYATRQRRRVS
ncbi:MAG TPA: hypothetical protein VEQ41_06505 [Solirubrobacterales bacterium]|nr:hypothetical protein [Solirubrobacterales bacterium]